ncbi:MAG: hypothetical protein P4N41_08675 [Negativicutes bacterium]|nr:hypothetical protein [Negativicutes bacterium]
MENLNAFWDRIAFLLVHVTNYELQLVLWATMAAAWRLSAVLAKHSARTREARLARRVAVFYAGLSLFFWLAHTVLV